MSQNDFTGPIPQKVSDRNDADARPARTPPGFLPSERVSRRWLIGVVVLAIIGATGIGAQLFLLNKAINLEAERSAWRASLEQRFKVQIGLETSIAAAQATLEKVKADIGVATEQLENKQVALTELEAARREAADAKRLADNATFERERALAVKLDAEQQLAALQEKIAAAKGEKEQMEKQLTTLMTEVASAQTQLKDVKIDLAEKARLEAQAENMRQEVSQLSARREVLQSEVNSSEKLRIELKNAEEEVAALRGDKAALAMRIAELKKDQQTLEAQKKISDSAAAASQKAEQDSVTKAGIARKKLDELEQERIAAESRFSDLTKMLAGVEGELRAKQVIADQLKNVEMNLEQRKAELKIVEDNLAKVRAALTQPGNTDSKSTSN